MILGIHASIRAGYPAALETASGLGCKALQILAYRRHHEPGDGELAAVRDGARERGLRLIVHARYVPFLGSRDAARHEHSVALLRRELRLSAALGAEGLILHAGAYAAGEDKARGLARVAEGVLRALEDGKAPVPLILENVPGGGRRLVEAIESR